MVSASPARAVRETISKADPDALLRVSSAFLPAGGEGNRLPSPAATVRLVAESARFAASVEDAAEKANSRMPRNGARKAAMLSVRLAAL